MRTRKTVGNLRELYNSNNELKDYIIVWKVEGKEYKKDTKGESTLEDYINIYKEFNSADFEELEFSSGNINYGVKDIEIKPKEKSILLNCISNEPNKQIEELINYIDLFKTGESCIGIGLIDELECFADYYEKDEEITLNQLLKDFQDEISSWSD